MLADRHVFRHVSASLAEKPNGRAIDGTAETGAHEPAAALGVQIGGECFIHIQIVQMLPFFSLALCVMG
jgi:hypothetical protein